MCKVASSVTFFASLAAITTVALSAAPAEALTLTLTTTSGDDYNVTVEETTFDELRGRANFLDLVPWFIEGIDGEDIEFDETIAFELATDAFNQFSLENSEFSNPNGTDDFVVGPLFIYGRASFGSAAFTTYDGNTIAGGPFVGSLLDPGSTAFYAVVDLDTEAIPTPALIPGLLGMGFAAIRKRNLTESDEA